MGGEDGVEVADEVNRLHEELTALDGRVQEAYFDGLPFSAELSG